MKNRGGSSHELTDEDLPVGIVGKLSRIKNNEGDGINHDEDTTAMKDGIDVGFTKDASAGSVIGNKCVVGVLASDTEESMKLR